jgi:hypothetical protein
VSTADRALEASPKIVDQLSKILNQAERAEEGSPERELFMERAMRMSQVYSIDLAVARSHREKKERIEQPEKRDFKVGEHGKPSKSAHFVDLLIAICDNHDIKVTISHSRVYVYGFGMPSDLDVAERLYAILSLQMVQEADKGLREGANTALQPMPKTVREEIPEDERAWGQHDGSPSDAGSCYYDEKDEELREVNGVKMRHRYVETGPYRETGYYDWVKSYPPPRFRNVPITDDEGNVVYEDKRVSVSDGRVWRANFYQGFISRTRMRLRDAKVQAMKEAGVDMKSETDSKAIALRDKAKEVRDYFEEENRVVLATGGTYGGAQVSSYSHLGAAAGDAAGARAKLGNEKDLDRS